MTRVAKGAVAGWAAGALLLAVGPTTGRTATAAVKPPTVAPAPLVVALPVKALPVRPPAALVTHDVAGIDFVGSPLHAPDVTGIDFLGAALAIRDVSGVNFVGVVAPGRMAAPPRAIAIGPR